MPCNNAVRDFYNAYAGKVLLNDFLRINRRHVAIKKLCDSFIPSGARVLEIGCGVGIISRHLKRSASSILSIDISDVNVRVARFFAGEGNAEFRVMDVCVEEPPGTYDAILLADVIEHIPAGEHNGLLQRLAGHLSASGVLVLTFPSPDYQQYLKDNKSHALQVVDEKVDPVTLASGSSLAPIYLRYVSIFGRNDYVHLVLARSAVFSAAEPDRSRTAEIVLRCKSVLWRLRNYTFLRKIRSTAPNDRQG